MVCDPQRAAVGHREWWPPQWILRDAWRPSAAHGNQFSNCCRLMPSFLILKRVVEGFKLSRRAAPAGPSMTPRVFFRIARICWRSISARLDGSLLPGSSWLSGGCESPLLAGGPKAARVLGDEASSAQLTCRLSPGERIAA